MFRRNAPMALAFLTCGEAGSQEGFALETVGQTDFPAFRPVGFLAIPEKDGVSRFIHQRRLLFSPPLFFPQP